MIMTKLRNHAREGKEKYLLLLSMTYQARAAIPSLKKIKDSHKIRVIALESEPIKLLRLSGLDYKTSADYINEEILEDIEKNAIAFAKEWSVNCNSKLTHRGISLPGLVEYELTFYFMDVLRGIHTVSAVLDKEQPDRVLVVPPRKRSLSGVEVAKDEDSYYRIIVKLCRLKKIGIEFIRHPKFTFNSAPETVTLNLFNRHFLISCPSELIRIIIKIREFFRIGIAKYYELFKHRRTESNRTHRNILFLNSNPLVSVAEELAFEKKNRVFLLGDYLNSYEKIYRLRNVFVRPFNHYFTRNIRRKIKEKQASLKRIYLEMVQCKSFIDSFTYRGIGFWDIIEEKFLYLFSHRFIYLIRHFEIVLHAVRKEGIEIVVSMTDVPPLEKTIINAGRFAKALTLILQNGASGFPFSFLPLSADKIAVWGDTTRNWLISLGVSSDRITVTGAPMFDIYSQKRNYASRKSLFERAEIPTGKKLIILATQHANKGHYYTNYHLSIKERFELLETVFHAIGSMQGIHLVIKLHPNDTDIQFPHEVAVHFGFTNYTLVKKEVPLYDLLMNCELLITSWSTVGLEALILKKPVISINLTGRPDWVPYSESGAAIGVYRPSDLFPAINKSLDCSSNMINASSHLRESFVQNYIFKNDGKSCSRAASLIIELADNQKRG